MASLFGLYPGNTYKQLLQIGSSNVGLSASFQTVQDGDGNDSVLQLSETAVKINASTITINGQTLTVTGTASITGTNTGNQTTAGTANEISVATGSTSPVISLPSALTFTGKTVTGGTYASPIFSGSVTGTYTLAGTPTISGPVLSGSVTGTYTLAGTPTISSPTISGTVTTTASYSAPVLLSTTTFADVSDPTKKIQYVLTGVSTGTTRNITWQDVAGTVYVSGGSDVAVADGGTNLSTIAQGSIIYGSATDVYSALAKDTNATRYLSNQGTSNNPSWNQVNLANGVTGTLGTSNGGTGGTLPVANGGTGVTSTTAYAVICGGTTSTAAHQPVASVGTSGQVLTSNGAGNLPTFQNNVATGKPIIQQVYQIQTSVATTTDTIPADNTTPQISEGLSAMSVSITPTNASNLLVIDVGVLASSSVANTMTVSLFAGTTCIAATAQSNAATFANCFKLRLITAASTTSTTLFTVNVGGTAAGTTTFNGRSSNQLYNGNANSYIHIQEITV